MHADPLAALPPVHQPRGGPVVLRGRWGSMLVMLIAWMSIILLTGVGGDAGTVLAPACVALVIGSIFYSALLARSPHFPLDEIGTLYAGVVLLYSVTPLVSFAILGAEWMPTRDARIIWLQPTPAEVARIGWYYVLYLLAFSVVYLVVRRRAPVTPRQRVTVPQSLLTAVVILYAVLSLGLVVINLVYDLRAATYSESYLVLFRLPLLLRQFVNVADGLRLVMELVLMVWLFSDFRRRRWVAAAWISFVAFDTVTSGGERMRLVILMLGAMVLYHKMVRPVRVWKAVAGAVLLVVGFTALGVYRMYRDVRHPTQFTSTVSAGEFEVLFVNALDMQRRVHTGEVGQVPVELYASDAISVVPSQLLPFAKQNLSSWYVTRFYPELARSGGGLAFGIIPQALLGLGWVDLLLRGALLGAVFGALHRMAQRNTHRIWYVVGYLWLTLTAYQSLRASTFFQLSPVVQQLIPAMLLVEGTRLVLRRTAGRTAALHGPVPG